MTPPQVVALLSTTPLPLNNETELQEEISKLLESRGVRHKREVELSPGNRVDFMLEGGLAIEVKIKAPKRAIYRQCERYCRHAQVSSLILLSNTATGFPPEVEGKPCWVASLGRGWL